MVNLCGRFQMSMDFALLLERYGIKVPEIVINPKAEVFPSGDVPVVLNQGEKKMKILKWGFSPSFAKRLIINARSETIDIKPTFKSAFNSRRCLVPANGFFEWQKTDGKSIKHRIHLGNDEIFSMAGIYDSFTDKDGSTFEAFTILTTSATEDLKRIHHRMPVILNKSDEDLWLDNDIKDFRLLKGLLRPYSERMIIEKV